MSAFRAALVALSAAVLTAACAAGQHASTAEETPSLDSTQGRVGSIQLAGVALAAPSASSYSTGADVALIVYIANNGRQGDTLTKVTSPAFPGGWDVVSAAALTSQAPQPTPSSSTGSPAGSTASSSAAQAGGTPQPIGAGAALALGQANLTPDGAGAKQTLVLKGLSATSAPLYPGSSVQITFTFANAGETTLTVPVKITSKPNAQTLPAAPSASG